MIKEHPVSWPWDSDYTQCKLQKEGHSMVSWIPKVYAVKGKELSLRTTTRQGCFVTQTEWDPGWVVVETYSTKPGKEALPNQNRHEWWREATTYPTSLKHRDY